MTSDTAKKIKSKNSKIERILAKAMWTSGLRYRKHRKDVFGNPDFCFIGKKVAVFCDSEFWHGKKLINGERFKKNVDSWEQKIKRNMKRDETVNEHLKNDGWVVLRFWGKEIEKNLDECIEKVKQAVKGQT